MDVAYARLQSKQSGEASGRASPVSLGSITSAEPLNTSAISPSHSPLTPSGPLDDLPGSPGTSLFARHRTLLLQQQAAQALLLASQPPEPTTCVSEKTGEDSDASSDDELSDYCPAVTPLEIECPPGTAPFSRLASCTSANVRTLAASAAEAASASSVLKQQSTFEAFEVEESSTEARYLRTALEKKVCEALSEAMLSFVGPSTL